MQIYLPVAELSVNWLLLLGLGGGVGLLSGLFGVSFLGESTEIAADGTSEAASSVSTNIGGVFGVRGILAQWNGVRLGAAWESHVFPAGASALILVTGRKQTLTMNAGVSL